MAVIETWLRQDLKGLVTVRSLQGQVFSLDNGGNLIGVKVTKDGKPVTLTGTVTGYCILSDGQTVTVTGSGKSGIQNGNEAYIVLPQLVYSVPGQISIVIKLTSGSVTTTLAACTGYVYRSRTSNEVVPPGTPIPDLATMEEVIRRATAATDAANTAATGAEKVDASMTKEGDVITIAVTDRDGNVTEKTVTDQTEAMKRKADIDGYYEELAAGTADQLVSTEAVTDTTPYLYRKSGGSVDIGNRETLEKIVGGTVAWNQLVTFVQKSYVSYDVTYVCNADGSISVSGTATGGSYFNVGSTMHGISGHKILIRGCPSRGSDTSYYLRDGYTAGKKDVGNGIIINKENDNLVPQIVVVNGTTVTNAVFKPQFFDLTAMFGPTIADYVYGLEQATPGAGVAWFRKLFPKDYYSYNPGELISVKTTSHDMVGFNLWDEEWEVGAYNTSTGTKTTTANDRIRSKNLIPVVPGTSYYIGSSTNATWSVLAYNRSGTFIPGSYKNVTNATYTASANTYYIVFWGATGFYGTTYKNDICINLSHSGSRNGEYEPYEKHSYPLADVELRGIISIDADSKLVYDGDEYAPDGTVKRKYRLINLGELNWILYSGYSNLFYVNTSDIKGSISNTTIADFICSKYTKCPAQVIGSDGYTNGFIAIDMPGRIYVNDTNYSDAAAFKTAVDGVHLICELITPTTEQVAPYNPTQVVDDWGTEEFVDTREVAIPVGHYTSYMANLRDKLQHLPSLADEDGEYIVKQTGTKMELSKLSSSGLAQGIFVETESAPVVSFADGADGQAMKAVKVAIEPVQDLHGYDAPWPAGGGSKTLLPLTIDTLKANNTGGTWENNTYVYRGVTYIVNLDNGGNVANVTVNGTAEYESSLILMLNVNSALTIGETYTMSGCPAGGSVTTFNLTLGVGPNSSRVGTDVGETNTFTYTSTYDQLTRNAYIAVLKGATITNKTFTPMLEAGSTATAYTPYSNICPITGWTGAKVTRTGKNLFDKTISRTVNKLRDDNGVEQDTLSSSYTADFGGVEPGTTYTLSGTITKTTGNGRIYFLDQYHNWISRSNGFSQEMMPYTFTTPANCKYLAIQYLNTASDLDDLQLEIGSVATEYEPFGQTYEVTFPADPGTVYGGTLDVVTGKLAVDRAMVVVSSAGSIGTASTGISYGTVTLSFTLPSENISNRHISSAYRFINRAPTATGYFRGLQSNKIYIYDDRFTSLEVANQILAEETPMFVLELATPQEITLSTTEIKTLLGINNVWSDAGNTSITYLADTKMYIDNRINSTRKLIAGIETGFVASKLYAVGDMLIIGDDLYKVMAQIAPGATITVGTNVTKTTVAEQLLALMNA